MKDTAPKSQGIIAVAALFGIVAFGVAMVAFGYGFGGALIIGLLIALLVAFILFLGWREPNAPLGAETPDVTAEPPSAPAPTAAATSAASVSASATATETAKPAEPAKATPAKAEKAKPAKAKATAASGPAGAPAGATNASKPAGLDGPRGGKADDLKQIKGVGPKMEKLLNSMGFYHFDQVAGWGATEVAWVDENLEGFKGRVTRDNWVDQAKTLASGGTTEFSKKVDKGGVY